MSWGLAQPSVTMSFINEEGFKIALLVLAVTVKGFACVSTRFYFILFYFTLNWTRSQSTDKKKTGKMWLTWQVLARLHDFIEYRLLYRLEVSRVFPISRHFGWANHRLLRATSLYRSRDSAQPMASRLYIAAVIRSGGVPWGRCMGVRLQVGRS